MKRRGVFRAQTMFILAAALLGVGGWLYVERVLIPHQVRAAAAQGQPRGNLSDLYPRWIGAKELLIHGRNPYSPEVSRQIQAGYYGRPLDSSRPNDPRDEQGFAYPVYVVFYLAPVIGLPFAIVQRAFLYLLIALTCASIPLWLHVMRWSAPMGTQLGLIALTLGSLAAVQGFKLQQMSLLVGGLVASAIALFVSDHPIGAGFLLALSTIKPQLVWLLVLWLFIWMMGDWRRRYRGPAAFLVTMVVLCVAPEFWLPHWIPLFWRALGEYRRYTGAMSVLDNSIGVPWSWAFELIAVAATVVTCWRQRGQPANSQSFAFVVGVVLANTVLVVPISAQYNQVLLIPALIFLFQKRRLIWRRTILSRVLFGITIALVSWPWLASTVLAGFSFVTAPETLDRVWAAPIWTTPQIPVAVAALMLVSARQRTFAHHESQ